MRASHPPRLAGLAAFRRWPAHLALAWLLLALAVVPAVGRLHQVVHAQGIDLAHAGNAGKNHIHLGSSAPGTRVAGQEHVHGFPGSLIASHSPADCLLLDQLALGDASPGVLVVLQAMVPALAPSMPHAAPFAQRHAALFQARGPPEA